MKVVLQRVERAAVSVDGEVKGRCGRGLLILVGVGLDDGEEDAAILAAKVAALRVFEDGNGKMNLSVSDIGGQALAISNFTLMASCRRGNRPDFSLASPPEEARALYDRFCEILSERIHTEKGVFGADMKIDAAADGPVTVCLDSKILMGPRRG